LLAGIIGVRLKVRLSYALTEKRNYSSTLVSIRTGVKWTFKCSLAGRQGHRQSDKPRCTAFVTPVSKVHGLTDQAAEFEVSTTSKFLASPLQRPMKKPLLTLLLFVSGCSSTSAATSEWKVEAFTDNPATVEKLERLVKRLDVELLVYPLNHSLAKQYKFDRETFVVCSRDRCYITWSIDTVFILVDSL
jgi:hypothetical protein